jgi:putative endonuclease
MSADKNKTEIGEKGEKLAAEFLAGKGYNIVALNWHYKHKEIDILVYDGDWLVVVEVKLRSSDYYGDPSEFVTLRKQRYLIEAAEAYLDTIPGAPEVRFDVISILGTEGNYKIEHIPDAFTPNP